MGSLPRLKIKDELRYRQGSTNETENCRACAYFKKAFYEFHREDGRQVEHRCELIGMGESRRYRVREDYKCNRQKPSMEWLSRFKKF